MSELTPRERRHQRTKESILAAARTIIASDGTEGLSIRAIADAIDYSPAGLYEYFGGKEEIISAVCGQGHLRLRQEMLLVDRQLPAADFLVQIGLRYVRFAVENPDYFLLMFTTESGGSELGDDSEEGAIPAGMLSEGSSFPILLSAIQRGIEEGAFTPRPGFGLMQMAYGAWAAVHGLAMLRITFARYLTLDYADADRLALESFARGLFQP
ncbi:MAG: TetR/AcrR family transcriptional regulator [Caldilineaceae bacterium]|nr:TetR/AcrR family transcriptional regulator [Caldilineaceae bacterium]